MSKKAVALTYDRPLMRHVVRAYWRRAVAPWIICGTAFLGTPLAVALYRGDRSWIVGALATAQVVVMLLGWSLYRAHLRNAFARLARLEGAPAKMEFDEETAIFTSVGGTNTIRWTAVKELWCYRTFWLLVLAPNEFVTLPGTCLDAEIRSSIRNRLSLLGARIR